MRENDTNKKDCDIIANQRKGDYMKSNLEIQEKLLMIYASWEGHAEHAGTYKLRTKIKGQIEAEIKKKELIANGTNTPHN